MQSIQKKHVTFVACLLFGLLALFVILHLDSINTWLNYVMLILRPVLIGLVLAYLCNPIFRLFENRLFVGIQLPSLRRALSLFLTYLLVLLALVALLLLIVPQLISSILDFVGNYKTYLSDAIVSINGLIQTVNGLLSVSIPQLEYSSIQQGIEGFLQNIELQAFLDSLLSVSNLSALFSTIESVFFIFTDTIFGFFISIYLLSSKEKRYAQVMRLRKAVLPEDIDARLSVLCKTADRSFGGFLRGKILDSTIVGIMVYIIISLMNVPYALLIAVFIGITDIVPVIGPFIGVIPSAVIILFTDPIKVIPFLLCILIVQQIDGNILAPKILGDNIGVSSLCVLISITIMGAIWGLAGMVLGVPLFATILELGNKYLEKKLRKRGIVDTEITDSEDDDGRKSSKKKAPAAPISALAGKGELSLAERDALRALSLAREHGVLENNAEDAEAFAAFSAALRSSPTHSAEADGACTNE